eukprot:COSAG03_NODE_15468_length_430_cov_0.779456_2_plen_38_part_01
MPGVVQVLDEVVVSRPKRRNVFIVSRAGGVKPSVRNTQ